MIIRKTRTEDADAIAAIFDEARAYMKASGIDQWQNGYPNKDTVLADVAEGISYVLTDEDGTVLASAMLCLDKPEPTYNVIYEGAWLSDAPYGTIHRIAVTNKRKGQGIATTLMQELERLSKEAGLSSTRIDTHRDNRSMRRHLEKDGYTYCGIIYLADGDERLAFEKLL